MFERVQLISTSKVQHQFQQGRSKPVFFLTQGRSCLSKHLSTEIRYKIAVAINLYYVSTIYLSVNDYVRSLKHIAQKIFFFCKNSVFLFQR